MPIVEADESLSSSASRSASMVAGSLSAPSSKAANARPETSGLASIPCMDAIPAPSPGTGANPAPAFAANISVVRGVCIMRRAWRFCLEKKLEELLLSLARTASRASLPSGSRRAHSALAAAKLTSGTASSRALCSAAVALALFTSARLATTACRTPTSLSCNIRSSRLNKGPRPEDRLNASTACWRVSGLPASSACCKISMHCASVAAQPRTTETAAIDTTRIHRIV